MLKTLSFSYCFFFSYVYTICKYLHLNKIKASWEIKFYGSEMRKKSLNVLKFGNTFFDGPFWTFCWH